MFHELRFGAERSGGDITAWASGAAPAQEAKEPQLGSAAEDRRGPQSIGK